MPAVQELLKKSPNDKKHYRFCLLDNGLKALLVHDPEIATALAAGDQQLLSSADSECHSGELSEDDMEDFSGTDEEEEESEDEGDEEHEHVRRHTQHHAHHGTGAVKKAAAALSVGVGHLTDPWSVQGLSHYLEHMLFMGSEQFPDENDYDAFLTAHGGASNACTEEECTTFHFDVKADALRPALERFAQFFIAPLLKADALDREVLAVDNEFSGVLQSDSCRMLQLRCHTACEGHVFRKFGWGNKKSLVDDPAAAGINVREELIQYYREQYSAERMNLVVLGGEDLDTLQQWAHDLFSKVPFGRGPRPQYTTAGFPFTGGRLYVLPAVRDEHRLTATFQLPCLEGKYRKKADEYLGHLIGHEGSGSLLSALKARGWATELSAGVGDQSSVTWLFEVSITLTEAGLTAGPGCGLSCVALLFEFIALLHAAGPQRWAFDELAAIAQLRFRFQEEEDAADFTAGLACDLFSYPADDVLAGQYLFDDWDPALVNELLSGMTPDAVRVDLCTHKYEAASKAVLADFPKAVAGMEPWFKFPYVEADLTSNMRNSWATLRTSTDIALPPRNDYIPTNFDLHCEPNSTDVVNGQHDSTATNIANSPAVGKLPADSTAPAFTESTAFPSPPTLLLDEPGLRVWHKMDRTFHQPRTNAYVRLASPAIYAAPRAAACSHLLIKLLEDQLCETTYLAEVAGLHYGIWWEGAAGIDFKLHGFSEKLPLLATFVARCLMNLQVVPERFERVKEALLRSYRNINTNPAKHATYQRLLGLKSLWWHADEVLPELEALTPADVQGFVPLLTADLHIEVFLHGNVVAAQAQQLAKQLHELLGQGTMHADARVAERCILLPKGCNLLHRSPVKNVEERNSVVEIYLQCCADTVLDRAVLNMLEQLMYEPCFDTLRTKEQLGYTVHSGTRRTHGVLGLCVVVVSGVHGPAHLDSRIEAFLAGFATVLEHMSEEEFEKQRQALLAIKKTKDRTLLDESERAWEHIANHSYAFHALRDECTYLSALKLNQVRNFYLAHLAPGSCTRRKLSVHIVGKANLDELDAAPPADVELIMRPENLKLQCGLWPAVMGDPHANC